jgi:ABC-type transporter Mla subunit MlaD
MARPLRWRHLTTGLVILAGIVALVAYVLTYARIGQLHGDTVSLYTVTNAASGVLNGTEVWLGGQKVGLVDAVRFRPVNEADTTERVAIQMTVLSQYLDRIRRDADVQLRPGSGLVGAPVVYITMGTSNAPPVHAGDTLRARAQAEGRRSRTADFSSLGDSLIAAGTPLQQLSRQIHETGVEIDKLRHRSEHQAADIGRAISRFAQRSTASRGSLSRLTHDQALHHAVARVTAQADSIHHLLTGTQHSLGRFRKDSTIFVDAHHVLSTMDTLRARFSPDALAQRSDSALARQLDRVHVQLDSLVTDAKRRPLRYLSL